MSSPASSIDQLLQLMARLREPETGCPWDLKQDFRSIAPSTIEEAYEVVDAIEKQDFNHLREELGDLLFQVVFYAQLGKEQQLFDFDSVAAAITDKLLRRHPHVFPDGTLESRIDPRKRPQDSEINQQWEMIKSQERGEKGHTGQLDDVPAGLPAATRALKLQKRASMVGFDWPNLEGVIGKFDEEMDELKEAIHTGDQQHILDELGDAFFCLVNIARHVKIEPETALRHANDKFVRRFGFIETALCNGGSSLQEANLEQMEALWQAAKRAEPK